MKQQQQQQPVKRSSSSSTNNPFEDFGGKVPKLTHTMTMRASVVSGAKYADFPIRFPSNEVGQAEIDLYWGQVIELYSEELAIPLQMTLGVSVMLPRQRLERPARIDQVYHETTGTLEHFADKLNNRVADAAAETYQGFTTHPSLRFEEGAFVIRLPPRTGIYSEHELFFQILGFRDSIAEVRMEKLNLDAKHVSKVVGYFNDTNKDFIETSIIWKGKEHMKDLWTVAVQGLANPPATPTSQLPFHTYMKNRSVRKGGVLPQIDLTLPNVMKRRNGVVAQMNSLLTEALSTLGVDGITITATYSKETNQLTLTSAGKIEGSRVTIDLDFDVGTVVFINQEENFLFGFDPAVGVGAGISYVTSPKTGKEDVLKHLLPLRLEWDGSSSFGHSATSWRPCLAYVKRNGDIHCRLQPFRPNTTTLRVYFVDKLCRGHHVFQDATTIFLTIELVLPPYVFPPFSAVTY